MMYKALLIGINEYVDGSKYSFLPAIKHDIYRLYKILHFSECDYSIQTIMSKNATFDYINKSIYEFFSKSDVSDTLFLHWAGHGSYHIHHGGRLICYDTNNNDNIISMQNIADLISNSPSTTKFCTFDCCHSGAIARSESDAKIKISGDGVVIMASSDYLGNSYETANVGIFTDLLIKGLGGEAANSSGIITALSLHDYICEKMEKISFPDKKTQTPVLDVKIAGRFILNRMLTGGSLDNGNKISCYDVAERNSTPEIKLFDESKKILKYTYLVKNKCFKFISYQLSNLVTITAEGKTPLFNSYEEKQKALIQRAINQLLKNELITKIDDTKEGMIMQLTDDGYELAEEVYFLEE